MYSNVDNNDEENICDICHSKLPPKDVLQKVSDQVNRSVNVILSQDKIICPNCKSNFLQGRRINDSEEKLLSLYMNTLKTYKYCWSGIQPEL